MNSSDLMFLHCKDCIETLPKGVSPADYKRLAVGITKDGRIVAWCERHDKLVASFALLNPPELACAGCKEGAPHVH